MGLNQTRNEVFRPHNDRFRQYLASSRGKSTKKTFWSKFGPKRPKLDPKLGFLPFSQTWFISFFKKCME